MRKRDRGAIGSEGVSGEKSGHPRKDDPTHGLSDCHFLALHFSLSPVEPLIRCL